MITVFCSNIQVSFVVAACYTPQVLDDVLVLDDVIVPVEKLVF